MAGIIYSVIIPVYKNEESLPRLFKALESMNLSLNCQMEAVFVVDGSPDSSFHIIKSALNDLPFAAQLIGHSRNFGSFPAIRTGLISAKGEFFVNFSYHWPRTSVM
jgi:glycosyltransferase involved in cell wall biosynthesis